MLLLAFIASVIVSNELFRGWRIDFTENSLYTLSDGTKRILENIDEPINLYFFYSDQAMAGIPSMAASSSNETQSPVFPDPVIPTQTAWVVRSLAS